MSKIPTKAKQVFKGIMFEVWQWEQKMYDGTSATFEKLRRPNTAEVIPIVDGKILIEIQKQPDRNESFISFPGGRCDWDEDPLAAAKRELLEETGYVSDEWVLFQEEEPVNKIDWTIYTYVARKCRLQQKPHLDAGEQIELKLITLEEFLDLHEDKRLRDKEFVQLMLRAKLDPEYKAELHKMLFGN